MQKRKLGKGGLGVSALGLGCMGMSFSYGPPKDKQEMISLIRSAVEHGQDNESTKFDSSDFPSVLPRIAPEALKANQNLIDLLGQIAGRNKATPAQIALAWLLARNRGSFRSQAPQSCIGSKRIWAQPQSSLLPKI